MDMNLRPSSGTPAHKVSNRGLIHSSIIRCFCESLKRILAHYLQAFRDRWFNEFPFAIRRRMPHPRSRHRQLLYGRKVRIELTLKLIAGSERGFGQLRSGKVGGAVRKHVPGCTRFEASHVVLGYVLGIGLCLFISVQRGLSALGVRCRLRAFDVAIPGGAGAE